MGAGTWAPLAAVPLAVLHARLASSTGLRSAAARSFVFALFFFAWFLAWLPQSLAQTLGVAGGFLTAGVIPAAALVWTLGLSLVWRVTGSWTLLALPFGWVVMEWGRTQGPLAFPWGAPGYALTNSPMAQWASVGGVSLLTLLVTATASVLAGSLSSSRRARLPLLGSAGVLWLLGWTWGLGQLASTPSSPRPSLREALLVQGNMDPRAKARGRSPAELQTYLSLTASALARTAADLVIWPETASPVSPSDPVLARAVSTWGVPFITGAPGDVPGEARNSAYGVTAARTERQDKRVLVPFGEVLPFERPLRSLYTPLLAALGLPGYTSLTAGRLTTLLPLGAAQVGVSICYESVFPALSAAAVRQGANLLVVISNDAWFGRGSGAEQHFQMGRIRAIETRRALLRAGNDGISASIDPWGQVMFRAPRGIRGAFAAPYRLWTGRSLYVMWGEWVTVGSGLTLFLTLSVRLAQNRHRSRPRNPR
ncbi:apolipoprotein N-acyltransferase [Deinococcus aquatilis]|uniref:apolipoprotein N-acyltransferase n=1 Tax=Deinococcus aquatilis TaxID=519440 RepID=UPI000A036346|nr:apolipoprotein N-acyltransferase [Deinococcus aquatilis]